MKNRRLWAGIFLGTFCLLLFLGKVYFSSLSEYRQGEEAYRRGDFRSAILHYDRAIHWYIPWSSSVENSVERLWEMGTKLEERGEKETALEAYWTLRSSLYGVRSFYTPRMEWIERANERIAALWTAGGPYSAGEKTLSPAARKEAYLKALRKDWAPKVGWAAVTELGFFGWVGSALGFIFSFLKAGGGLARRRALFWGGCTIGFYGLWIMGMVRA